MGMKIIHEENYQTQYKAQPWVDTLRDAVTTFQSRAHVDITGSKGFESILASEANSEAYLDMVSSLVGTDKEMQDVVKSVAKHSMEDVRTGFSAEAADAFGNNANYSSLAKLNSWVIVGYTARSKALELFHTFTSDDPTVSFKFNLDYLVKGDDPTRYYRPQAERDGDIGFMYDLPQLLPSDNMVEQLDYLEKDTTVNSTNGGSQVWIKIRDTNGGGGVSGNFFTENGGEYDRTKFTLEKNPKITGIKYSIPTDSTPETGSMAVYFDRKDGFGEQQRKSFYNTIRIPYAKGTKSADATIFGSIDLDSGDWTFASTGPITHIQVDIRLTNIGNELGTIRAGSQQIIESFSVDNHPYGTVPIAPEMTDDFNIAGEGVSAVAYFTDKVTSGMATMRDILFERELDNAYNKPKDQYMLTNKLGGWKGNLDFPLTARLPGGGDPYSWMHQGMKYTLVNHFARGETELLFEDDTPRQWYILGHETDINLIPELTFTNWTGEGGVGGSGDKYGFGVNGKVGIIDNMERSIRVIASPYRRHFQDKSGKRLPMRAVLKSMKLDQPTTLYLPYSFRVYSGISSEYSKRTGLIVSARDCVKVMSLAQSRITFQGNSDSLYSDIVRTNQMPSVAFPENSTKLEITAS